MSKVIVITGASGGIGAALAKNLGARGNHLVLAARREPELLRVAGESGNALPVVTDVTRRSDVERLFRAALDKFGRVDVWINNAGRGINRKVLDLTDEDFDAMMAVNVKSALYGMQCIVPHFQERGEGHLINVSSFLGRVPFVTARSAYNAAKSALGILTANLRVDLRRTHPNIHVSLVMPGVVTTEFSTNALYGVPLVMRPGSQVAVQSADEVAAAVSDLIDHPAAELYTNPSSRDTALKYFSDVEAFEAHF